MTSLWKVGIRPQSERNILLEYRLIECRYVTLKSYMNNNRLFVSFDSIRKACRQAKNIQKRKLRFRPNSET